MTGARRGWRRMRGAAERILLCAWDPLGVAGDPAAFDEYGTVADRIAGLLARDAGAEAIAAALLAVERQEMGLAGDQARAWRAAEALTGEASPAALDKRKKSR